MVDVNTKGPIKAHTTTDRTAFNKNIDNVSPALKFITKNYVKDENRGAADNEKDAAKRIDTAKLIKISDIVANAVNSVIGLDEICPYIAKARTILKTLILYPNGKRERILNYNTANTAIKNAALHKEINALVEDNFFNNYKIEEYLDDCTEQVTVGSGAFIMLNITRPVLDNLINGSALSELTGNESLDVKGMQIKYRQSIQSELRKNFVEVEPETGLDSSYPLGVTYLAAKNIGLVAPKGMNNLKRSGIEAIWGDSDTSLTSNEFPIIAPETGITITDNLSTLFIHDIGTRSEKVLKSIEGTESLLGRIDERLKKKEQKELDDDLKSNGREERDNLSSLANINSHDNPKILGTNPSATTQILDASQREKLEEVFRDRRSYETNRTLIIKRSNLYSDDPYGEPIKISIPTTAFIPCRLNNDFKRFNGGFILLDENGQFLNQIKDGKSYYSNVNKNNSISNTAPLNSTDGLIQTLKSIQTGSECELDMSEFARLYKLQIEQDLKQAVASGSTGADISVVLEQEALMMFLERSLEKQRTRVLYVPEEYFTYVAIDYSRLGVGQSFVMKARHFISRLATLDIADTLAQLENAQVRHEMTVDLGEHDTDPEGSIAISRAAWFRSNPSVHGMLSNGVVCIPDIVDAIKQQMLVVKVNKNNNKFFVAPNITTQPIERGSHKLIDDASRENILNQIANELHLPKSWLDNKESGNNFQIEALTEQETLKNETVLWQATIAKGFTDIIKKNIWLNSPLKAKIIDVIIENLDLAKSPDSKDPIEYSNDRELVAIVLADYLNNLNVSLTEPTTMDKVNKIKDKIALVAELVKQWEESSGAKVVMDTLIAETGLDETKLKSENVSSILKAYFTNKAMVMMGLPTPYEDILNNGEGGGMMSLLNEVNDMMQNTTSFLTKFTKNYLTAVGKAGDKIEKVADKALGIGNPSTPGENGENNGSGEFSPDGTTPPSGEETDTEFKSEDNPGDEGLAQSAVTGDGFEFGGEPSTPIVDDQNGGGEPAEASLAEAKEASIEPQSEGGEPQPNEGDNPQEPEQTEAPQPNEDNPQREPLEFNFSDAEETPEVETTTPPVVEDKQPEEPNEPAQEEPAIEKGEFKPEGEEPEEDKGEFKPEDAPNLNTEIDFKA